MVELHVDDFDCAPDGRVLERASIDAGSTVLTAPEGVLRATDNGKSIAIPGAVDLEATIGLAQRREVRSAVITPDALTTLIGTLVDPTRPPDEQEEPFIASVHEGRSITVAGAGPDGRLLLTEVARVLSPTSITLARAASTAVAGVEVILNDPGVARLSNYARRPVSGLTVDLGDRSITDGRMAIGSRGLVSDTARFSSRDEGKRVTIRAAGLLMTTIRSVDDATRANLEQPAQHTVADVPADIWRTDSRRGLERLLAHLGAQNVTSAEIRFGAGVYDFTRSPDATGTHAAIGLLGLRNLTFRGAGQGVTVLRLMPGQELNTDTHVIETVDCRRLTFRDLSVNGAYLALGNANEQMHGLQINEGSEEIAVQHVAVVQSAGDGIRMLGSLDRKVRRVWVESCRLVKNKRTGVGFQRAVEFAWVRNCYIEMTPPSSDQCIDFEPTGGSPGVLVAPTDVIIDSNVLVHASGTVAVAISGVRGSDPARRVKFTRNVLLGGEVFCTDVAELTIEDNVVLLGDPAQAAGFIVNVQRGGQQVVISRNVLISERAATNGAINLSEVNGRQVSRALVAGNLCVVPAGSGISLFGSDDVAVEGNVLVATGRCINGVHVNAEASAVNHVSVRDNDITVEGAGSWERGIAFAAGQPIQHVLAVGNSIAHASEGVAFLGSAGAPFVQTPVCALNRVDDDVTSPLAGLERLPQRAIVVGGAASRGGSGQGSGAGSSMAGIGDPEGRVTGSVGDVFQRLDANAEAALYVKQSGDRTTDGWVPK